MVTSFAPPFKDLDDTPEPDTGTHVIYAVENATGTTHSDVVVKVVAEGFQRPTGICVVENIVYVADLDKIWKLEDTNNDGDFLDTGEATGLFAAREHWDTTNYHDFTFGLTHLDGYLYGALSVAVDFGAEGFNGDNTANRGTWFRVSTSTGEIEFLAGGLRTPNGLGLGPENKIFGTDNQGSWNPANSLYEFTEGHFYGHYNRWTAEDGLSNPLIQPSTFWDSSVYWDSTETPEYGNMYQGGIRRFTRPAVYFPHNDIAKSPSEPVLIGDQHPMFKGQMYVAELTQGGVRRVFLEKVNGRFQGAVMNFTQGNVAGNNRMIWGPDGSLYLGGMGASNTWAWRDTKYGLQKLIPNGNNVFEVRTLRAVTDGFILTMTQPVDAATFENLENYTSLGVRQYLNQTTAYGTGQVDRADLTVTTAEALDDGHSVKLTVPGLIEESVIEFGFNDGFVSSEGEELWTESVFYTLNAIPSESEEAWTYWVASNFPGSADLEEIGAEADPDQDGVTNLEEFSAGTHPDIYDYGASVLKGADQMSVLLFTKTAGFRHANIPYGITKLKEMAAENDILLYHTEDASIFDYNNYLRHFNTVLFFNTSGDILDEQQQQEFQLYINKGGSFLGIHAACDTEKDWPWYGELVGAYFLSHPAKQTATVNILESHPTTEGLPLLWERYDEWYNFTNNVHDNENITVLANVDESTYSGTQMGEIHPMIWYQHYDGGRSYFTAMGDTAESFDDPLYMSNILKALQWCNTDNKNAPLGHKVELGLNNSMVELADVNPLFTYQIETSDDLDTWTIMDTSVGEPLQLPAPSDTSMQKRFYRVTVVSQE